MFLGNESEFFEENVCTDHDIHREQIRQLGAQRPDSAWILSDYDAWERNPYYSGPEVPHPEDDRNEPDTHARVAAEAEAQAHEESLKNECLGDNYSQEYE